MNLLDRLPEFRSFERVPTIITVAALALLIGLGVWQLKRMAWKETLIAQYELARTFPPIDISTGKAPPITSLEFRTVKLTGMFLHDKELHLVGRYYRGELGYHVLTPFQIPGKQDLLLVNRGWIPAEKKAHDTRPETLIEGNVTLTGMVKAPRRRGMFTPEHRAKDNLWMWADLPAMSDATGLPLLPVVIQTRDPAHDGSSLPVPGTGDVTLHNDHFGYALTWFAIAAGVLFIFLTYHYKPAGRPHS